MIDLTDSETLMRYRRTGSLGADMPAARLQKAARALAWAPDGTWFLAGDQDIVSFDAAGAFLRRWSTGVPAWSLAVDPHGDLWAGGQGQIEIFTPAGEPQGIWRNPDHFGLVTGISVTAEDIFVADARTRWIHRFDQQHNLVNHIGDRHRKGGFHIPNGVLDFALDEDGTVVVANPGMHRVERYRPDGESMGHFGRFGQHDPEGFPGCCNPTNLALGPEGEIVVSEKAGPRVKVYDAQGTLLAVVAAGDDFDPACKNMDLAVTGTGSIGVVDPMERTVVVFEPVAVGGEGAVSRSSTV